MIRQPRMTAGDLTDLTRVIGRLGSVTLIVDVEPLVAPWNEKQQSFTEGARLLLATVKTVPTVSIVVFATNSRRTRPNPEPIAGISVVVLVHAAKPFRTRYMRGLPRPIAVVGDQLLTDGILAWRLGSPFIEWEHREPTPWWPRAQMRLGRRLAPLFFRPPIERWKNDVPK